MQHHMIQLEIVSAKEAIFSGAVAAVFVTGSQGELGIYPDHTPLLTTLKPGQVRCQYADGKQDIFYIKGGLLEVQPAIVTVLADTAMHATDLDEAAAMEAKQRAEEALAERRADFDYAKTSAELAEAAAQLRILRQLRRK